MVDLSLVRTYMDILENLTFSVHLAFQKLCLLYVLTCRQGKLSVCLATSERVRLSSLFDSRLCAVSMLLTWGYFQGAKIHLLLMLFWDFSHAYIYTHN